MIRGGVLSLQLVDDVRLDVLDVQSLIVVRRFHVRRELAQCAHRVPTTPTQLYQYVQNQENLISVSNKPYMSITNSATDLRTVI